MNSNADTFFYVVLAMVFTATFTFLWIGIKLFGDAWKSYRDTYLKGTVRGLDAMFITIPPQLLLYISIMAFLFISLIVGLITSRVIIGCIFGMAAFFTPRIILKIVKMRRDAKFREQLPDALTSIANSMRAGFSLFQALELIQREMPPPLSQEFRVAVQEMRFGVQLDDALRNMSNRMPGEDLDLVVTAVSIAKNVGGNLAEMLDNLSMTIRERQKMEGRIRALTSQGKMQGYIMCLMPFAVAAGVYYVSPDLFDVLFSTFYGLILVGAVIVLEFFGIMIIRKIVTIDV